MGKQIWITVVVLLSMIGISEAQVTQGTVNSRTLDGNGNKITSTVVGPARGLDVNVIAGGGSSGTPYLDADAIVNQTTTAIHGHGYMYNGVTWDRIRGDTTNGMWVNCKTGCSAGTLITVADAGNSTLVTLAGGGNFTGAAFDLTNYASWSVSVFSDKASSASGFTIEWSEDNVNWGAADVTTYVSAQTNMASFGRKARYVRINYTNSGVAQVTFRVYAWAHPFVRQTRKFVGNALEDTDTAQIVISSLQGHTTAGGGAWVPVKVNPSGALTADVTQSTSPWVVSGTIATSNAFLLDATFTGRFAAAYVDADAVANQTTTAVHGQSYFYNGVTWDRMRGTVADGLLVNLGANNDVTVTGTVAVSNAFLLDATFTGRINTLGQKAMVASTPVVLASDQSSIPVTVASLPLPLGAATEATLATRLADATFTGRFVAATLDADALVNETTTAVHGKCYLYNGATWDRCRGAIATGLLVNISNATLAVTQSGTWNIGTLTSITNPVAVTGTFFQATQPVSIAATVTVQGAKTNNNAAPGATNVGTLPCVATAVAPTQTEGNQVGCSVNLSGAIRTIETNTITTANNDGSCASGAASFTAIASNASRTWLAVWASPANTDDVYLKLGATATAADARFAPGQPLNFTSGRVYTGVIDAFPASGTQAVCVMELN